MSPPSCCVESSALDWVEWDGDDSPTCRVVQVHSWWSSETSVPYIAVRPSGGSSWEGKNETASRRGEVGAKERRI
jgi:hypothetical protein